MKRVLRGFTYNFHRNLGWKDRLIRLALGLIAIGSWYFGMIAGTVGVVIAAAGLMVLGTAAASRCSVTYMLDANTMSEAEKNRLTQKGIKYE